MSSLSSSHGSHQGCTTIGRGRIAHAHYSLVELICARLVADPTSNILVISSLVPLESLMDDIARRIDPLAIPHRRLVGSHLGVVRSLLPYDYSICVRTAPLASPLVPLYSLAVSIVYRIASDATVSVCEDPI